MKCAIVILSYFTNLVFFFSCLAGSRVVRFDVWYVWCGLMCGTCGMMRFHVWYVWCGLMCGTCGAVRCLSLLHGYCGEIWWQFVLAKWI